MTVIAYALLALLLGAAFCFVGYRFFLVMLPIWGFFAGLWHGFICVITFIISLFTDNVQMYEVGNSGSWYDLGFLLGAGIALGGSGRGSRRKKKRC